MTLDTKFPDFTFAFQPIVNVSTGNVVSFEALLRGINNESAEQVFKLVHKSSLYRFDECLHLGAVKLASELEIACKLNLNLMPQTLLNSSDPLSSTLKMANSVGISPESITIEVIESELIGDVGLFAEHINQYRGLGLGIAIDDFGAGYSGLNLLADFQPDSIKIDTTLIRSIDSRGPRQAITRGIIRTCLDLGIDIVAEGIETESEFLWCQDEGIELFQGHLFAKPGFRHLPVAFYPKLKGAEK